ncbi:MAG: zinc ribbon domain-containing protein, partial [Planctomycetota bacterium]
MNKRPCPHCRAPLSFPEAAPGQKVQCPRCGTLFRAAAPAAHSEEGAGLPPAEGGHEIIQTTSERVAEFRRRRKWAFIKPLFLTLVTGTILVGVGSFVFRDLKKKGVLDRLFEKRKTPVKKEEVGLGRGFHLLEDGYWTVFDDPELISRPVGKPPKKKDVVHDVEADGLTVHAVLYKGPYYIARAEGGLVPAAVGIYADPNQLGKGQEVFW